MIAMADGAVCCVTCRAGGIRGRSRVCRCGCRRHLPLVARIRTATRSVVALFEIVNERGHCRVVHHGEGGHPPFALTDGAGDLRGREAFVHTNQGWKRWWRAFTTIAVTGSAEVVVGF